MKHKPISHILIAVIFIAAMSMAGALHSQEGRLLTPLNKITATGEVTIGRGPTGSWVISPWFSVQRNGTPLRKLEVTLDGHRLRETMPGQYAGIRITDMIPAVGNTMNFSIASRPFPSPSPLLTEKIAISGMAVIGSLAEITQPVSGSNLNATTLGTALVVNWTGGVSPYDLGVVKPSGGAALEIFSQKGLPGHSLSLPATLFLPGISYSIVLSYKMKPFVFKMSDRHISLLLDKSSTVILRCAVISSISIN